MLCFQAAGKEDADRQAVKSAHTSERTDALPVIAIFHTPEDTSSIPAAETSGTSPMTFESSACVTSLINESYHSLDTDVLSSNMCGTASSGGGAAAGRGIEKTSVKCCTITSSSSCGVAVRLWLWLLSTTLNNSLGNASLFSMLCTVAAGLASKLADDDCCCRMRLCCVRSWLRVC